MSSLTTAASSSSSMEEHCYSVSAEEVVGTHLSLGIGGGGGGGDKRMLTTLPPSRTVVQLFGEVLSVQDGDEAQALRHHHTGRPTAASRKKKRRDAAAGGASATDAAANGHHHQSKKTKTTAARRDDGGGGGGGGRKKLRLTAAQATLLEDSFRAHNILSHVCRFMHAPHAPFIHTYVILHSSSLPLMGRIYQGEKQELARQAGLSARQVEVWFQNRRARTKLKQTEVDCDLLRRWCARLSDDNDRLRRDLADLRRAAAASAGLGAVVCCASCGADRQLALAAAADNVLPSVASPSHSPHLT
jgi:homeobox-leucine zipper protein